MSQRVNPKPKNVNNILDEKLEFKPGIDYRALNLNKEEEKSLDTAVENLLAGPFKDDILVSIDTDNGIIRPVMYPIYKQLNKRFPEIAPNGISVALNTEDGRPVAIKRNMNNGDNKGAVGPVAGLIKTSNEALLGGLTLRGLIDNQVKEELGHEIGLAAEYSIDWDNILEITSNHPTNQMEFYVPVKTIRTFDELFQNQERIENGKAFQLAEKIVDISDKEIVEQIEKTDCANQHAFTLLMSLGWGAIRAARFIEELPIPQK